MLSLISNDMFILWKINLFKNSNPQTYEPVVIFVSCYCSMQDQALPLWRKKLHTHKEGRKSHICPSPFQHLYFSNNVQHLLLFLFWAFFQQKLKKANHHLPWHCEVDIWRVECNFIWDFNSSLEVKKLECCCWPAVLSKAFHTRVNLESVGRTATHLFLVDASQDCSHSFWVYHLLI